MDLSDPTRAVTPTLDGPVLAVLARAGRPLTVGEIAALSARGSEIGIRKSVSRLVQQGIVRATVMGRNRVHELNRDHVAAQVAEILADLRSELWRRMREAVGGWEVQPLYACVFGSAARADGTVDSDIDLLLVHPLFPGEFTPDSKRQATGVLGVLGDLASALAAAKTQTKPADPESWNRQLDELRGSVQRWSGNPLQVIDLSPIEWRLPTGGTDSLLREVREANIELVKDLSLWAVSTS